MAQLLAITSMDILNAGMLRQNRILYMFLQIL